MVIPPDSSRARAWRSVLDTLQTRVPEILAAKASHAVAADREAIELTFADRESARILTLPAYRWAPGAIDDAALTLEHQLQTFNGGRRYDSTAFDAASASLRTVRKQKWALEGEADALRIQSNSLIALDRRFLQSSDPYNDDRHFRRLAASKDTSAQVVLGTVREIIDRLDRVSTKTKQAIRSDFDRQTSRGRWIHPLQGDATHHLRAFREVLDKYQREAQKAADALEPAESAALDAYKTAKSQRDELATFNAVNEHTDELISQMKDTAQALRDAFVDAVAAHVANGGEAADFGSISVAALRQLDANSLNEIYQQVVAFGQDELGIPPVDGMHFTSVEGDKETAITDFLNWVERTTPVLQVEPIQLVQPSVIYAAPNVPTIDQIAAIVNGARNDPGVYAKAGGLYQFLESDEVPFNIISGTDAKAFRKANVRLVVSAGENRGNTIKEAVRASRDVYEMRLLDQALGNTLPSFHSAIATPPIMNSVVQTRREMRRFAVATVALQQAREREANFYANPKTGEPWKDGQPHPNGKQFERAQQALENAREIVDQTRADLDKSLTHIAQQVESRTQQLTVELRPLGDLLQSMGVHGEMANRIATAAKDVQCHAANFGFPGLLPAAIENRLPTPTRPEAVIPGSFSVDRELMGAYQRAAAFAAAFVDAHQNGDIARQQAATNDLGVAVAELPGTPHLPPALTAVTLPTSIRYGIVGAALCVLRDAKQRGESPIITADSVIFTEATRPSGQVVDSWSKALEPLKTYGQFDSELVQTAVASVALAIAAQNGDVHPSIGGRPEILEIVDRNISALGFCNAPERGVFQTQSPAIAAPVSTERFFS